MADPRFFTSAGPFSVAALTEKNGIEKRDDGLMLSGLAPLAEAGADDLSFFSNIKLKGELAETSAGAVLIKPEHADLVPDGCLALLCDDPYRSMADITQMFFPDTAQSRSSRGCAEMCLKICTPTPCSGKMFDIQAMSLSAPVLRLVIIAISAPMHQSATGWCWGVIAR